MSEQLPSSILEEGRERLARLLPSLLASSLKAASSHVDGLTPRTLRGQSISRQIRYDNLHALTVHRSPGGAWQANLHLVKSPRGVPCIIGTADTDQLPTKRAGERAARRLLSLALIEAQHNEAAGQDRLPDDLRIFTLGALEFSIPGEIVDEIARTGTDQERAALGRQCLNTSLGCLSPYGDIDTAGWARVGSSDRMLAHRGMVLLLSSGRGEHSLSLRDDRTPTR